MWFKVSSVLAIAAALQPSLCIELTPPYEGTQYIDGEVSAKLLGTAAPNVCYYGHFPRFLSHHQPTGGDSSLFVYSRLHL